MSSNSSSNNEDSDSGTPKNGVRKPLKARAAQIAKPESNQEKKTGCNCTAVVLVVEDNFYNVVPLKMILRTSYNIQIERAENGKLGYEAYERNLRKTCCEKYFKLVFMDINMPVMDGYESARIMFETHSQLVQQPEFAHIPRPVIFAMTAHQNESTVSKCVQTGMNGILYKPVNKKGLHEQILKFFPDHCENLNQRS